MDERLQRYVQKVLEVERQQKQRALNRSELRELAMGVGLSAADWEAVEKSYHDHLTRGEGFLKYQNWSDAITEFQECQALFPKDAESLQYLAEAYAGRWRDQEDEADREKALHYGQQSLEVAPTQDRMLQLVSELRKGSPRKNNGQKAWWLIGGGALVLILLLLFFVTFRQNPAEQNKDTLAKPEKPEVETVPQEETKPAETAPPPAFTEKDRNRDLPVTFQNSPTSDFVWQKYTADWERYTTGGATNWLLNGTLVSKNSNTTRLFLKVSALDAEGATLYEKSIKIADKNHPTIRANDLIPVSHNAYSDPGLDVHALRLQVESARQEPPAGDYTPSPKADFTWDVPQPPNVSLEIRERYAGVGTRMSKSGFYKATLEVKNTGTLSLKELKLRFRWYVDGELIETKELYVVAVNDPPLQPGKTFVESGTYLLQDIGKKPVECKIAVASVQYD